MEKTRILERYKKEEEKLLISKLLDKIEFVEKQNKIHTTDFLTQIELQLVKSILNLLDYKNYKIYGVIENAQRNLVILYPDKFKNLFEENTFNYNTICKCIRISNCMENYNHRNYLGGCIKLGIKREKLGDIIVFENGADIIVDNDIANFLVTNLSSLNRFKNANIEFIGLEQITKKEQEFKDLKIIVSSLRLDNVVSELSRTSRSKALEILKQERVFINYKNEIKPTKQISRGNEITIRGYGKFYVDDISETTRSGKSIVKIKKFV